MSDIDITIPVRESTRLSLRMHAGDGSYGDTKFDLSHNRGGLNRVLRELLLLKLRSGQPHWVPDGDRGTKRNHMHKLRCTLSKQVSDLDQAKTLTVVGIHPTYTQRHRSVVVEED